MNMLLASLKGQPLPTQALINCRFLKNLTELLNLQRQCVLSPMPLLEEFMEEFVKVNPFFSDDDPEEERLRKSNDALQQERAIKESLRTDFQFGELAFGYLSNCPFFDYLVLRTRTVVRRQNCHPGCIDQMDLDDPLKYDRAEKVIDNDLSLAYAVGMPNKAEGQSLEAKFLSEFYNPENFEKDCPTHSAKKRHSTTLEVTQLPSAILLSLQRGYHDQNQVLRKKSQAVILDKEFRLETHEKDSATYTLHACGRHSGRIVNID